jgi:DNA-binding IclR family transcriptional regulator
MGLLRMLKAAGYKRIAQTGTDVLRCLNESSEMMNVTEIALATGRNGSFVSAALQKLEQQGLVRSTRGKSFSHTSAGADLDRFMITKRGRQAVEQGPHFTFNYPN